MRPSPIPTTALELCVVVAPPPRPAVVAGVDRDLLRHSRVNAARKRWNAAVGKTPGVSEKGVTANLTPFSLATRRSHRAEHAPDGNAPQHRFVRGFALQIKYDPAVRVVGL
jgi:hypothetical protein